MLIKPIKTNSDYRFSQVLNAVPAIDYFSPTVYPHIQIKFKKTQREYERTKQIEKENVRLLQRLTAIMNTKPVENFWKSPRPNFLNRVYIDYPKKVNSLRNETPTNTRTLSEIRKGASANRCDTCNGKQLMKKNKVNL